MTNFFPSLKQTPKKSQFSLKRKKSLKNEESEFNNYVCPLKGENHNQVNPKGNDLVTNNLSVSFLQKNLKSLTHEIF
jgi:hypothetical protein